MKPRRITALLAVLLSLVASIVLAVHLYDYRFRYNSALTFGLFRWASAYASGNYQLLRDCDYPPSILAALIPLTWLGLKAGYWIWQTAQLASLALVLLMFLRERKKPLDWEFTAIAISLCFLFPQTTGSVYEAQPTPMLLLLLTLAWMSTRRDRPMLAGLLLALSALFKLYPAAMGGYFLFRECYRELLWASLFFATGVVLTGPDAWRHLFAQGAPFYLGSADWMANVRGVGTVQAAFALVDWLRIGSGASHLLVSAGGLALVSDLAIIGVAAALTMRVRPGTDEDGLCFALWLFALPLLSPIAWAQYLVLALPLYILAGADVMDVWVLRVRLGDTPTGIWFSFVMLVSGVVGLSLPYYSGALRDLHMYFIGTAIGYCGAALYLWNIVGMIEMKDDCERISGAAPDIVQAPPAR